ncbi:hypothetical protein OG864_02335 [Streptomyces sp. NBC_00124]|uniref:hypothetical protein n=1 Tax=Streptomyces sp. NBC_00124 TaxID=2975662 RepID=UPI00224EE7F9|nr:hypothetical protein [Streptomyces sp. NBC_00124]MCX5357584.1 hypothetical protein [Streptomyces sp. NBC_00124]
MAARTPWRHHRHALGLGIHTDRLQQVLLDGHEPVPPGYLPGDPHSEVLALDDDVPRPGRERPTRRHVREGCRKGPCWRPEYQLADRLKRPS